MGESLASVFIHRAGVEITLKNQVSPITSEEFAVLYAMLVIGLKSPKVSSEAEKEIARQLLDRYVDESLLPFLGLNTSAKEAFGRIRFTFGKFFSIRSAPHISKERMEQLRELSYPLGATILDAAVVVRLIQEAPDTDLALFFKDAEGRVKGNDQLQPDVKRRALQLLENLTVQFTHER